MATSVGAIVINGVLKQDIWLNKFNWSLIMLILSINTSVFYRFTDLFPLLSSFILGYVIEIL
ncbi:hypothetical protein PKHYL_30710 [Psychrobacter sp. KH172YL61]|uniref:hypothetical protein n=1 Tax=Psychrobacter pacificensis TaxID=112002 RepID=UPI0010B49CE6|nr:hypothetical protein PKHYL_30710 [Psychrobacter sp. KH172YL61]